MPGQRLGSVAVSALLLFSLSCDKGGSKLPLEPAYQEPEDASISGTVVVGEAALEGVAVSLAGPEAASVVTDGAGGFMFTQLKRGTYSLAISGFDPTLHAFPTTQKTVSAMDGNGVRVDFVGTLVPQPPAPATGLQVEAMGPESTVLSWTDESDDETGFRIERKDGGEGVWEAIGEADADSTRFPDTGLTPNTTYGYRIQACNEVGCSAYTTEALATTYEIPPAPPADLTAEADGSEAISLTWSDLSNNENGFQLERRAPADSSWVELANTPKDIVLFADQDLTPATAYVYRVKACNQVGCSEYSEEATATTDDLPPDAPMDLAAAAAGSSTVDLTWKDQSENEAGFQVERKEGAEGSWSQVGTAGAGGESFRDLGLSPITTYFYRVRACNDFGCSDFSGEATATTDGISGPNLFISNLYITQSTQTLDGGVPLVAGKAGFLRVFALADEENEIQPEVRVRFYHSGSLVHTETISAPGTSVPTSVSESSLGYSWNVGVAKTLITPGLEISAEVDPGNVVAEAKESDNDYPESGSPMAMDVRSPSTFNVTFVPVLQNVNGLEGDVTGGNASSFFSDVLRLFPIADADADLHAQYATDAPALESDNANGAWGTVLSEINALRVAEGGSHHYFGVVKTAYTSGVAGMGYLGWPTAIGWDQLPSGAGVAAHEWGHNLNRRHAPGCGAGSPDEGYPYEDGKIGVWGMNVGTGSLKSPATYFDFMSYCGPEWISDYSYEAILDSRQAQGASGVSGPSEPSLLVWGRVEDGRIFLEPAFQVDTRAEMPRNGGPYLLEGLDDQGGALFSMAFEPMEVPDGKPGEGHFGFAIPLSSFHEADLARIRVRESGGAVAVAEPRGGPQRTSAPDLGLEKVSGSVVEMTWDAGAFPMAMVRDAATGEILSFGRGGLVRFPRQSSEVEILFSDGLFSSRPIRRVLR